MKLTIFAATGGIGRHLIGQALAAGHDVTAVTRNPASLPTEVRAVKADLATAQPAALATAVTGADAVLSALGPRSKAEYGIAATGTRAITRAMQAAGVRRVVVVSAAPVGTVASPRRPRPPKHDPGDGFVMRHLLSPLITAALRDLYADLAVMEDILAGSGLDWTAGAAATADQQGRNRRLPHRLRAQSPARPDRLPRGRRPPHARRARATRNHRTDHRHRLLTAAGLAWLPGQPWLRLDLS